MNTENGITSYISAKTIILIIVVIIILYTGATIISSSLSSSTGTGIISNKIICKTGQAIQNGACVDISSCGLLPTTGIACSTNVMICDQDLGNIWRCPLPCESATNIVPQFGLGSCRKGEVKCDSSGRYYCENDKQVCNGQGSFYGVGYDCICDVDCYGVNCENKCPPGTFLYNNTCKPILSCLNGTFSKATNQCICNDGYYNKNDMCLLVPNCNNGTFNRKTELCNCDSGYFGNACDVRCASGQYLYNGNCTNILTCKNGGTFNPSSDSCTCVGSWKGLTCDYSSSLNCNNSGSVVLDSNGLFLNCSCYLGTYGPSCTDTKISKCGGNGIPQYDSKGVFTGCLCDLGFSGNVCQLSGAVLCNNNGTPNVKSDGQTFSGTCSCKSGYDQPFCCDPNDKPKDMNPCIENEPVCTKSGWQKSYKTCENISRTGELEWSYDDTKDKGCANLAAGGTFNYDSKYNYLLSCNESNGVPTIKISRGCPVTLTCPDCSNDVSSTLAVSGGTNNYTPKVCVCDSGSNYQNVCRTVQTVPGQDKMPDLCNYEATKNTPKRFECGGGTGQFLWHCDGFKPSLKSIDSNDIDYKNSLINCFEKSNSINYDQVWREGTVPLYPSIDNDKCEVSGSNTSIAHDMPDTSISYYSLWDNPAANIVGNNLIYRTGSNRYDKQKYNLVNAKMVNGVPTLLASLNGKDMASNPGCFTDITANPANYCNGQGTFNQYCYTSGGSSIGCDDQEAYYRIDDGYCSCNAGYTGNQCQFTDTNMCNGNGKVSSPQTGKSIKLTDISCTCDTYSSTAGVSKTYLCKYSADRNCNGRGTLNANGVCSCQNAWGGTYCDINKCGYGGTPNADGSACVGCQAAWADGNLCTTIVCKNGTIPYDDGNSCMCNRPMQVGPLCEDKYKK